MFESAFTLQSRVAEVDTLNPAFLQHFASAPLTGRGGKGGVWLAATPEIRRAMPISSYPGLGRWLLSPLPATAQYRRERTELKGFITSEGRERAQPMALQVAHARWILSTS